MPLIIWIPPLIAVGLARVHSGTVLGRWADATYPHTWAGRIRQRRYALFQQLLAQHPTPARHILDVGGTPYFWQLMLQGQTPAFRVTILNPALLPTSPEPWLRTIRGDARALPFLGHSVDMVFSNSVIEHVGTQEDQRAMADEVRRVGRRYFVQTPNYYFPIEPHTLFLGFQFLPREGQVFVLTHVHLARASHHWRPRKYPSAEDARALANSIRMLSATQMRRLFPGAQLYRERLLGLTKSLIVYK